MSSHHLSDDVLELYLLRHLRDPKLAETEEHLLCCSHCRQRTEKIQDYLDVMAAACGGVLARAHTHKISPKELNWKSLVTSVPSQVYWHGALGTAVLLVTFNFAWLSNVRNRPLPTNVAAISRTLSSKGMASTWQPAAEDFAISPRVRQSSAVRRRPRAVAKRLPPFQEFPPVAQRAPMPESLLLLDPPPILVTSAQIAQDLLFEPVFALSTPPPKPHFARRAFRVMLFPFRKIGELFVERL